MPPRPALIEPQPGLRVLEDICVHEPDGLRRLGGVDRDEVAQREQLLDRRHELHAELAGTLGVDEGVERGEAHAERVRPLRDEDTDAAEADDAERLAVELDALPLRAVPLPAPQVVVRLRDVARLREQERERVLGSREDVRLRRVHDHDPAAGRLGDVDVVEADAGPADHDEVTPGFEHLGGHLRRAADHQRGRAVDRAEQVGRRQPGLQVDVETGGGHRLQAAGGKGLTDEDAGGHEGARLPAVAGRAPNGYPVVHAFSRSAMRRTPSPRSSSPSANDMRA